MAKSRLEPKKIVRYAESNVPRQGISSIPAPRIQRSTGGASPSDSLDSDLSNTGGSGTSGTGLGTGGSNDNTPPPPPAPAGETRSFFFDGATHLTGSFNHVGGRSLYYGTIHTSISPGWTQEETGSFTFFSVSNINNPTDYRRTFSFERTSGSDGYADYLVVSLSSGSVFQTSRRKLQISPNFYSGSGGTNEEIFLQAGFSRGTVYPPKIYTSAGPVDQITAATHFTQSYNGSVQALSNLALQDIVHTYSVGGSHGDSEINQYKGTIGNLSLSKNKNYYFNENIGPNAETNSNIHLLYRFEGNASASEATSDLDVIGTEAYVSSSL